jgi:hypothetical protein
MALLMRRAVATAGLIALAAVVSMRAATPADAQVRAGMLYNFSQFVDWPAEAIPSSRELLICLAGGDPLGQLAGEMDGRHVNDRAIRVSLLNDRDDPRRCHMLFMDDPSEKQVAATLQRIGNAPVLTMGESPQFTAAGGVVRLYREGGRVRFEINVAQAERARLHVSSKVLALARIVRSGV